jgi:hypothetical protein
MKFKKPNLASANTPETKTAKTHNAFIQNAQCQKAQFFVSRLVFNMRTKLTRATAQLKSPRSVCLKHDIHR